MGDFNIKPIESDQQRAQFYHDILRDLEAFEYMLQNGLIEERSDMIGAEQEICIVDKIGNPASKALEILGDINSPLFTNELALYNLEVNLSPQKLTGDCFSKTAEELRTAMSHGEDIAARHGSQLLLTGNLPTLKLRHLLFDFMTPEERYKTLSRELLELRGHNFEVFLEGVDDFRTSLDSVLFEACNTSFQLHLQIDPREFAMMHNWAQMISGPVLAACTNSPLLFGKELWAENRISLFKQSLDTRRKLNHSRVKLPRVYFGNDWLRESPLAIWQKDVTRFPVLLRGYGEEDPMESLKRGVTPQLKSIRLHNGTTYTWNRLCYGVANNSPHIRIECRYLPSGPTMVDEMANFAFWIGLMKGIPEDKKSFWEKTDFRVAKNNFIHAARYGIQAGQHWFGENISSKKLILDKLIPLAEEGLKSVGVDQDDITSNLRIIEKRVHSGQTGSEWLIRNYRLLHDRYKPAVALRLLVQQCLIYQKEDIPVHNWDPEMVKDNVFISPQIQDEKELVEDIMNQEVVTVKENVSLEVIKNMMTWQGFNHLPVEDRNGDLVGMLSSSFFKEKQLSETLLAKDVMVKNVIQIGPGATIEEAKTTMIEHKIGCLPVVENDKILGIITATDLPMIS